MGKAQDAAGSARDEARHAAQKAQERDITPGAEDPWKDPPRD
jgi:hypothetical protein